MILTVGRTLRSLDRGDRGFTLVELLIVIIVLAVLAAIAVPRFMDSGERAKEASLRANLKLVRNAVLSFYSDTGYYPSTLADLTGAGAPANGKDRTGAFRAITSANYRGPYLYEVPSDPVSGASFTYGATLPNVGKVTSSAAGNGLDGTAYNTW
ncbi:MAG: prepilin-type N-terminal cleavage/methylation domain-containing protein [Armatimonadetes bacterium]|nr:prepilin-type N-terminal cleavage/methylation domain-containing protein [Armatimonadota bacterium]